MKHRIILLLVLLVVIASCAPINGKKCEGNTLLSFTFDIPVSIYPTVDTMHVGDTLWIESSYDQNLYNSENRKNYNVSSVDFSIQMGLNALESNPVTGVHNPYIFDIIGHTIPVSVSGGTLTQHSYTSEGDKMKIKYGWVLHQSGPFMINSNNFYAGRHWQESGQHITQCPDEFLFINYVTNNKAENGYHLYRLAKDTSFNNVSKSDYDKGGSYSFYVK